MQKMNAEKKRTLRIVLFGILGVAIVTALIILIPQVIIPGNNYRDAVALRDAGKYEEAVKAFTDLGDYNDAKTQILATRYAEGEAKRQAQDWDGAVAAFEAAGSYNDAATQISATRYAEGKAKCAAQDWDGAVAAFEAAGSYNDAATQISATRYTEGEAKRAAQDWDGAAAAFEAAGAYSDAAEQIPATRCAEGEAKREAQDWSGALAAFEAAEADDEIIETKYRQARFLTDSGDYAGAVGIMLTIKGYQDVDSLLKSDENLVAALEEILKPYKTAGSVITFGQYEQDNDPENGPEAIEWIVLDHDEANHRSLLVSKAGLDVMPYSTAKEETTWENCSVRNWLNSDFLSTAFSPEEQSAVAAAETDNSESQGYSGWDTTGGNQTSDMVFLLSYGEANKYLGAVYGESSMEPRVALTAYTIARFAWTSGSNQTADGVPAGTWWLRSPGSLQDQAAVVTDDGSVAGFDVSFDNTAVRPAVWIDLDLLTF